jgi:hypothetical protein
MGGISGPPVRIGLRRSDGTRGCGSRDWGDDLDSPGGIRPTVGPQAAGTPGRHAVRGSRRDAATAAPMGAAGLRDEPRRDESAVRVDAGVSVLLYNADWEHLTEPSGAGQRFEGFIRDHLPLEHPDDLAAGHAAAMLWSFARNPLSHSFGVGKERASFPGFRAQSEPLRCISPSRALVFTSATSASFCEATCRDLSFYVTVPRLPVGTAIRLRSPSASRALRGRPPRAYGPCSVQITGEPPKTSRVDYCGGPD